MPRACIRLVIAAWFVAAASVPARADVGPNSEWYLVPGMNVGFTIEEAAAHFLLGAEVSAARLFRRGAWYGVYADGVRDFDRETVRLNLGGEIGYTIVGVDAGLGYEAGNEDHLGVRVRACFTGAWLGVCAGSFIRAGDTDQRATGEVSLLLKIPIPLQGNQLRPVR